MRRWRVVCAAQVFSQEHMVMCDLLGEEMEKRRQLVAHMAQVEDDKRLLETAIVVGANKVPLPSATIGTTYSHPSTRATDGPRYTKSPKDVPRYTFPQRNLHKKLLLGLKASHCGFNTGFDAAGPVYYLLYLGDHWTSKMRKIWHWSTP